MIYQLVKWNLGWIMAIPLAGLMALVYLLYPTHGNQFEMVMPLCILLYIATRRPQFFSDEPCTVFEAALPIHGRQIFYARVLALGVFIGPPIFAAAAARLVRGGAAGWIDARIILEIGAAFTVVLLFPLCLRAGKFAVSRKPPSNVMTLVTFGAALIIGTLAVRTLPAQAVFAICAAATGALLWYGWARTPEAFEIVAAEGQRAVAKLPRRLSGPGTEAAAKTEGDVAEAQQSLTQAAQSWKPGWNLWARMPLLRIVFSTSYPMAVLLVPVASLFGLWGWPLLAFYMGAIFVGVHKDTPWLHTIPVSRHKLFALLLLPLVALVIGGLAVQTGFFLANGPEGLVTTGPGPFWEIYSYGGPMNVKVPVAYWLRARGGEAPVIQAPWGERCQPHTYTLFGVALYNPYAVEDGKSMEFFEWQFERATKAVYGKAITRSQYEAALLSGPLVVQQLRITALKLTAMIAGCLLMIYIFQFVWWYRVRRRVRTAVVGTSVCLLVFGVIVWMGGISHLGTYEMQSGKELVEAALIWCAKALPQSPLLLGGVLIAFIGLLYWMVDKQFCELEISLLPRVARS